MNLITQYTRTRSVLQHNRRGGAAVPVELRESVDVIVPVRKKRCISGLKAVERGEPVEAGVRL